MLALTINAWVGMLPRGILSASPIEPDGQKELRARALIEALAELRPDIVFLQECLPEPTFSRSVGDALGLEVASTVVNGGLRLLGRGIPSGVGSGSGLAILARPELDMRQPQILTLSGVGVANQWFSVHLLPRRAALAVEIKWQGRPVSLLNTHISYAYPEPEDLDRGWDVLKSKGLVDGVPPLWLRAVNRASSWTRDLEMQRLGSWMELQRKLGHGLILGGDLNLDPDSRQVSELLRTTGLVDPLEEFEPKAYSWDPQRNSHVAYSLAPAWLDGTPKSIVMRLMAEFDARPQRPDHLFVSPDLTVTKAGLVLDQPVDGMLPSDHYGIMAQID